MSTTADEPDKGPPDVVQEVARELYRWRAEYEGWTVAWENPVVDRSGYLREAEQLCAIMARRVNDVLSVQRGGETDEEDQG